MSENDYGLASVSLLIIVALLLGNISQCAIRREMHAHAVKAGYGAWVVNETDGHTTFKWNDEINAEKGRK